MSELQVALLVIGFGVIVAVYAFGWWQQRRYRRRFGTAFKENYPDALYQDSSDSPSGWLHLDPTSMTDKVGTSALGTQEAGFSPSILPDESCELLDARSDFIMELQLEEPSPPVVLDGLWQRKFDFGKPLRVCGLPLASKHWERAIAESHSLYARFRIALQLVDRGGVVSEAKLADFRDLVLGVAKLIKANITVPELSKTHHHAVALDAFCAQVDQMVGVNLIAQGERALIGGEIAQVADMHGMTLQSDGAFHLLDAQGHSLFSVVNQDTQPFQHHTLKTHSTPGITLLLDVPRVANPVLHFDQMMRVAHEFAKQIRASMVDDLGVPLSAGSLAQIRAQIAEVETKMFDHGIEPGSSQARRLFS